MAGDVDGLIERLRERASNPDRRVDRRPSQFEAGIASLDLGGLLSRLTQARADLAQSVAASRSGGIDPASRAKAGQIAQQMRTPVSSELPPVADPGTLDRVEAELGFVLPALLRRLYLEIADGGFGPGSGLLGVQAAAARYLELRREPYGPGGAEWPERLLPLVDQEPGVDCVDAGSPGGRIVSWDPELVDERRGARGWARSFVDTSPSLGAWLDAWVGSRTFQETMAEQVARAQVKAAREARAAIGAKTPQERAAMGLPEVGWERVVWGGLGLEDDEQPG